MVNDVIAKIERLSITMGNALDLGYNLTRHEKALPQGLAATKWRGRS